MEIRVNWMMVFLSFMWLIIPVASFADMKIATSPIQQVAQLTKIDVQPSGPEGLYTESDVVFHFILINLKEVLFFTAGSVCSVVLWRKPLKWKGREVVIQIGSTRKRL